MPMKRGGPPDIDELSHWWVENLASWQTEVQDPDDAQGIDRLIPTANSQFAKPFQTLGLKDLIAQDTTGQQHQPEEGHPVGGQEQYSVVNDPLLVDYIAAADLALQQPDVIAPTLSTSR